MLPQSLHVLLLMCLLRLTPSLALAREVFHTGFDEFAQGRGQLAGRDHWEVTQGGGLVHGVDLDVVPGLGKSGFLGFHPPAVPFVSVFRDFTDLIPQNMPSPIGFYSLIGIEDSTNGFRDNFYLTFYNADRRLLGAINFDNTETNLGIWRYDGIDLIATGASFVTGNVHELFVEFDLAANRWSADLDGIPLFEKSLFNASGESLTFGSVAVEWELTDLVNPGNNWMLFDDWSLRFPDEPQVLEAVEAKRIRVDHTGRVFHLKWEASSGLAYQVEWSEDLVDWFADTPRSPDPAFSDNITARRRYYRVVSQVAGSVNSPKGGQP